MMMHVLIGLAMVAGLAAAQPAPAVGNAWYEFLMARHLESAGDTDGAIAAYKRAAALDPTAAEIHTALAELYARQNKIDECVSEGERALAINPDNLGAHRILGLVYASLAQSRSRRGGGRDYSGDAIKHLEQVHALSRVPEGSVLLALGRLYIRAGNHEKAIPVLRQLVDQEPQYSEAVVLLAQAYTDAGRADEATALLEDLAKDDPDYLTTLAEQHERANRWDKAAEAYARAAERDPANEALKSRWVMALLNSPAEADAAKATGILRKMLEAKPDDAQNLYLLSQSERRTKDFAGAEASARQLIQRDPAGFLGPLALAQVFEDQRNYRKVVETLSPIVAKYTTPGDARPRGDVARIFLHLGFAYQQLKEYDHAIETLERAKPFARDSSVLFQLASVFDRQKRFVDAERTFKEILQKEPSNAPALNYLGYMLAERGERLEEAVGYIKRALDADADNASYLDSLGWVYFKMNRLDLAEEPLRRASLDLTTNSVVQDHWGDLLFKLARYPEAIEAWERALAGDGDSIDRKEIDRKIKAARGKVK